MPKDINKIKKDENKKTIIVIFILISIVIIAFIGISAKSMKDSFSTKNISLDPIDVTINSDSNNQGHYVSAKISLEINEKELKKLDMNNVIYIITDSIKNVDYNKLTSKDGTEYLKNFILKSLNEQYEGINKVYLEDFKTDFSNNDVIEPEKYKEDTNKREEILKGFKWGK